MRAAARRLAYLSLALVAACGTRRQSNVRSAERTVVEVDNQGFADMTVYVYEGTRRVRLGLATGASTTKLTLPASMARGVRSLRFLCDPIGGNRKSVSQEITVGPGDTIRLVIPPA